MVAVWRRSGGRYLVEWEGAGGTGDGFEKEWAGWGSQNREELSRGREEGHVSQFA
jgi:hypothetical protein